MRAAISRAPVFEVVAGADVEILLPEDDDRSSPSLAALLQPGMKVYCSASQAVRRMFPVPPFRPADYPGGERIDVTVSLREDGVSASVAGVGVECAIPAELSPAKSPERTADAVRTAFSKLGGTEYVLGELSVEDPRHLFAPPRILNDLRRELVERLDEARARKMEDKISAALDDEPSAGLKPHEPRAVRRLKIRAGQTVPAGEWDEVVVVMGEGGDRVATPVYTSETDFPKLRTEVKRLVHRGCVRWEASDLATLRMLRGLGVEDLTADWTLFAFNAQALRELSDLGELRRQPARPCGKRIRRGVPRAAVDASVHFAHRAGFASGGPCGFLARRPVGDDKAHAAHVRRAARCVFQGGYIVGPALVAEVLDDVTWAADIASFAEVW